MYRLFVVFLNLLRTPKLLRTMKPGVLICVSISLSLSLLAEGSRELAPNGNIVIGGNNTTDVAALLIDHNLYNFFASYTNPDPNSRLYIHIADPEKECIYLGFSFGHFNQNTPNPTPVSYEYRIKDPNGNVVFGPVFVDITGGNIQNWSQATTGPTQIYGAGGYNAVQVMSSDLLSGGWAGAGDYYVEFDYSGSGNGLLIDFWDISVSDCTQSPVTERKGRVWSYNWAIFAINDFNFPNRPFNGAYYVCAPDPDNPEAAFITKIDFNGAGFRPAAFNLAINSFGVSNTGNVMEDRRSVDSLNATQSEYAVFLNDPVDLCITADIGVIELLGVSRCDAGTYCIKYIASKEGQIDLLLDFDGQDDLYTPGTADLMVAVNVASGDVGKPSCIAWDGLDGLGNALAENSATGIPIVISYAQGIYHFPIYDAEYMTNGVIVESIRPAGPAPLLYYDDSEIAVTSGSGEPVMQLTGCTLPCHRWTNFINDDIIGFGNKNTINSWWFSQRIIRSEIFFLPGYLSCGITGPERICENETAELTLQAFPQPAGTDIPQIVSSVWSGPAIVGAHEGATITIDGGGMYHVQVTWLTPLGDTCSSACEKQVAVDPISFGFIDTLILKGETIEINGETYGEGGQYTQVLVATNGCDSILTIDISILQTILHFNLDACISVPGQGSDINYNEFTPVYPNPLSCAGLDATILYRDNPTVNAHSCTPGVGGSPAMCISSLDNCTYDPGNEKSVVFELTITPAPDTAVAVTGLSFYERAPEMFDWIGGTTGLNNYPTLFGIRVLKDGVEIYRAADVPTTTDWTLESFDFLGVEGFVVDTVSTFRFEFLGYCLIGNGAMVPAWDLDEIRVVAGCVSPAHQNGLVSGRVLTEFGHKINDVEISLSADLAFTNPVVTITDQNGAYRLADLPDSHTYYVRANKNTDFLQGVSTLDLIKMQKHLLGIESFESPLQWIAADANRSNTVSALDIVHLRKLILGHYSVLPANTSWRFGNARQELILSNPWTFAETLEIQREELKSGSFDFRAVKIGDVNRSLSSITSEVETRSGKQLTLEFKEQYVEAGKVAVVEISSSDFSSIAGFQFELSMRNGEMLEFRSAALDMTDAYAISGDQVRISWNDIVMKTVNQDETLFAVFVRPGRSGFLSEFLQLNTYSLAAEAYVGDQTEIADIDFRVLQPEISQQESRLFQNTPNPFSAETQVQFYLSHDNAIKLRVYTTNGTLLWEKTGLFVQGHHTITLPREELQMHNGILICQLQCDEVMESIRMMIID